MTMPCHQRLLGGWLQIAHGAGLCFDSATEPLTVRSRRALALPSKAPGELNQSHFLSFNAAPSNVVTIACIRPSLVM